ncbi:unnamed protein product [Sympodiomycopsis kandeliae]
MLKQVLLFTWINLLAVISAAVVQSRDGGLIDVNSQSFSGSDGKGVGGGLAGSLQICLLSDLVCLGDAGAVVVGALGADAVSEGKATGAGGTQGSEAVAKSNGLFGLGAVEAADLCVAKNCLGGAGALVLGNATASGIGGAIPKSLQSSTSQQQPQQQAKKQSSVSPSSSSSSAAKPRTTGPPLPFFILESLSESQSSTGSTNNLKKVNSRQLKSNPRRLTEADQ